MIAQARIIVLTLLLSFTCALQGEILAAKEEGKKSKFNLELGNSFYFHQDSIHQFNFRYPDKKRGFKPYIAPTLLIATGTAFHLSDKIKYNFQDWIQSKTNYSGNADEYLPYVPLAAVYGLNAFGIKGKNNFGNRTALATKSFLLNVILMKSLKVSINAERPNGEDESFPSGHSSAAFAMAHFMHKEYGELSPWYSIGAYACAASVATLRVVKNKHWIGDVFAGAGIGILSTELIYLTHLYKWDREHLKNWDVFPFQTREHKGLTLVYHF